MTRVYNDVLKFLFGLAKSPKTTHFIYRNIHLQIKLQDKTIANKTDLCPGTDGHWTKCVSSSLS